MQTTHRPSRFLKRTTHTLRCGVSLLEVVIVLLVMGILAAVAAPKYADSIQRCRLQSTARRIAADLRYARQLARTTGGDQRVEFDLAENTYDLIDVADLDHGLESYQEFLGSAASSVILIAVSFGEDGTESEVTFDRYGRTQFDGFLQIAAYGSTATLQVDGATGRVEVQP